MLLKNKTIYLRFLRATDAARVFEAIEESRPELERFTIGPPRVHSIEDVTTFIERLKERRRRRTDFGFGIFDAATKQYLGQIGLHGVASANRAGEIGYWIRTSRRNRGFATEATRALVKTAFELAGVERLQICCDVRNAASLRVIGKVGFREEGLLRHRQRDADGIWEDLKIWSLLKEEYAAGPIRGEPVGAWNECGERIL
jgi:RimJ/RimL family protein N-acetyltransferase